MPFTEATIYETLRYSSMVPTGIFHKALGDTALGEYLIPKDTFVLANFYHIHHSKEIWEDPENFRPERFLSQDEKSVVKHECLMAFSTGKRLCLGKSVAN
jgi:cytochrome P450